eukprot:COSAG06_NODE_699_length_12972_cov_41.323390_3_plen_183_part_00
MFCFPQAEDAEEIVELISSNATALAKTMKKQKEEEERKEGSKGRGKGKGEKKKNKQTVAKKEDEQEQQEQEEEENDVVTSMGSAPEAAPSAPPKKSRRRFSISQGGSKSPDVNQAPLQEGMYAVKQGSKKLELQVGSMALQVFKGGKPVENILYKDMLGWAEMSGGGGLEIELSDDRVLQVR